MQPTNSNPDNFFISYPYSQSSLGCFCFSIPWA
jgi:hypothetical protein